MYRHFAVATLALTAAVAMFADGTQRTALTQHMAGRQQRIQQRALKHTPILVGNPTPLGDADDGWAIGTPSSGPTAGRARNMNPFDALLAAGYTRDYLETLSEEERQRLLTDRQHGAAASPNHRQQASALDRASAARSGAPAGSE